MKQLIQRIQKVLDINFIKQRTFSANTMEELEKVWQNELMDNGWDVEKPMGVRWSWLRFDYEYYFVAKYVVQSQ